MSKAFKTSEHWDRILEKKAKKFNQQTTILVDGTPQTGKTTFIKFLQVVAQDIQDFPRSQQVAHANLINSSLLIIDQMRAQKINFLTAQAQQAAIKLRQADPPIQALEVLQTDHNFRSFSQVVPNFQYLLTALKTPFSVQSALKVHMRPRQFEHICFQTPQRQYHVLHTQNGHYYVQNADCIVYTASLCDYFQPSRLNYQMNKLLFSLHNFEILINQRQFQTVPVIVLLTQFDRFLEIYQFQPFSTYFLDCKSSEVDSVVRYVAKRFKAVNLNEKRNVYCFAVDLTDCVRMGRVLNEIEEILRQERVRGVFG